MDDILSNLESECPISEIIPRLYLGSALNAADTKLVERLGITHLLVIGDELEVALNPSESLHIPLPDFFDANIFPVLKPALEFIDGVLAKPDSVLLVHCMMGVSRSASVVLAWWMRRKSIREFDVALDQLRELRPCAKPNVGFAYQLTMWGRWGWVIKEDAEEYKRVTRDKRDFGAWVVGTRRVWMKELWVKKVRCCGTS